MALADDIALYALGYWAHESHPFVLEHLCLNTIQRKSPCTACSDTCPVGIDIHSEGKTDWSACTNCNLCITACPTSAINQSQASFEAIRRYVLEGERPVSFACQRAEQPADISCVCLAALPWDLLAAAALGPGLVLAAEACKTCPHETMVASVKERVHQLRTFLGKEVFADLVHTHVDPNLARDGQSKRISMAAAGHTAQSGASNLFSQTEKPALSCYRALLYEVLDQRTQQGNPPLVHWMALANEGNCQGCEICSKICPHHAIALHIPNCETANEDIGQAAIEQSLAYTEQQFWVHQADRCTQCGLCYLSCPTENIDGWHRISTAAIPALTTSPIEVSLCEKCGRAFKPEGDETRCKACSRIRFA